MLPAGWQGEQDIGTGGMEGWGHGGIVGDEWSPSKRTEKQAGRNWRNQQQQANGWDGVGSRVQHRMCVGQQVHTCCVAEGRRHRELRKVRCGEKGIRPRILSTNDNVAIYPRSVTL